MASWPPMPAESMKMNIAFIDIDRVISNGDARFALAESVAITFPYKSKDYWDTYWHAAFNPENLRMDTLIPGADLQLARIMQNYDVIYLTSRPEHMREATRAWFKENGLPTTPDLLMKPPPFQFTKTYVWKVGTIHQMAYMYKAIDVLVIDDEQTILDELARLATPFTLRAYKSLDMQEPDVDEHPF